MATPTAKRRIKKAVAVFPGRDGWCYTSGEDAYVELAVRLVDLGLTVDQAVELLQLAYDTAAAEFGK
ncbi:hypothetical protein SAMN05421505_120114 [Sinosporangium album]|uniref:Uncharacterized protein n=1 Tax=Sinosporangium album TaxID=504805 RepID=A0A1G8EIB5_9ACTN|nr:hypothetical protein [Sinosporangium album]SDH69644.1 hypothetical protein SAMN05421505_120114 [Sinosporangium album]